MKKILIPIDGSEYSQRAMEKGKELAEKLGSSIVLLNVEFLAITYGEYGLTTEMLDLVKDNSQKILEESQKNFKNTDLDVQTVALRGDVASAILEYIEGNDIDLVVMGSQGMSAGALGGLFIGSITNKVINKTITPVLVVK